MYIMKKNTLTKRIEAAKKRMCLNLLDLLFFNLKEELYYAKK